MRTMKKFFVTYRGKDGQQEVVPIEAADRQGLFKELAQRGISPIKVEEADGKSKPRKTSHRRGAKPSGTFKGIVAGIVVVVAAVAAFLFLTKDKPAKPEQAETKRPSKIAEVTPAPATPYKAEEPKPEPPKPLPPQRVGELRDGYRLLPSGRLHKVQGIITSGVERVSLADRTFNHDSDRMIAHVLLAEPGGIMLGDSESIMRGFNEAFERSLAEEIVIERDDTDEVRELKKAVLDARKELLDLMSKGRTAEEVMVEARNQLLELTLYREDLEKEVLRLAEDGMTQQDYDELIGAANLMLQERGSKEIQMPKMVADAIELRYRHEEAKIEEQLKALDEEERKLQRQSEEEQ